MSISIYSGASCLIIHESVDLVAGLQLLMWLADVPRHFLFYLYLNFLASSWTGFSFIKYHHGHYNGKLIGDILAAKSLQSCPTLCNPIDGSPPPGSCLGFSRQEHWSGLPFPSPMHESEKWKWSRSVVSDSSRPHGLQPTRLLHPWNFPGKSTGVGCHCLLWGILGIILNRGFPHIIEFIKVIMLVTRMFKFNDHLILVILPFCIYDCKF